VGVDIGFAADHRHSFGAGRSHEDHLATKGLGDSLGSWAGAASTGDHSRRRSGRLGHDQPIARRQRGLQRRQRNGARRGLAVLHQSDVYRPVGPGNLAEFTCAVEWVDDPGAIGAEAGGVVLAFFRQNGISWASGLQFVHQQVVRSTVAFVFAHGDFGFGQLGSNRNQQSPGQCCQPGRQFMIILHDSRGYLAWSSQRGYPRHMASIGIAGAGFSGAVIARELAEAGHQCHVFDTRDHVGGNCHTERHETGVLVHRYGPHIFHTDNERVWDYINRFGHMVEYNHKVKTTVEGTVFSLPVNLHTINQVYGTALSPTEAQEFITGTEALDLGHEPENFEEQALTMIGRRLYELFFEGYTRKQWGVSPTALPASILKRLPLRFNYEDSYFNHPHQAIPAKGYTPIVQAILDHPGIQVSLSTELDPASATEYDHVVWSGPLDAFFDYDLGRLGYRTLDFEEFVVDGDFQGTPVMNYGDEQVPFTRITEHKHFAPAEIHDKTVCFREFSRDHGPDDIPYYPVRLVDDKELLESYEARAAANDNVTFVGRLGTYRYLDMDVTIAEALAIADTLRTQVC